MKKLTLILILSVLLISAACSKSNDQTGNEPDGPADPIPEEIVDPGYENPFRSVVKFSTEFVLGYTLHNNSGNVYFYDMSYTLFRLENEEWEQVFSQDSGAALYSLNPGIIREYHVEWGDAVREQGDTAGHNSIPPGTYLFVRKVFINPNEIDEFEYLRIEFDVSAQNNMSSHNASLRQSYLDFVMSGISSGNIVLSGTVDVSRSGIAFSLENRSGTEYVYGEEWELAQYKDGHWQYVPPAGNDFDWISILNIIRNGGIQDYKIQWDQVFGKLPPGTYVWIREYSPSSEFPLPDRRYTKEYVIIDFYITENSPEVLDVTEAPRLYLELAEYRNVTDRGITVVLENVTEYDLLINAFIGSIIQDGSWLPEKEDYFWPDYDTWEWDVLPGNTRRSFNLDWSLSHGRLPPEQYDMFIVVFGIAPPPHPTGDFQEAFEITVNIRG